MKGHFKAQRVSWTAAILLIAISGSGCRKANLVSTQDEVRIGQEAARQFESQNRVETNSADAQRVRRIGQRLLAAIEERGVPYSFKVVDSQTVNAVSLPGGPVYIYRGLLNLVGGDDDELAAVMAHEIGHVEGRHAAKQMSTQVQAQALIDLFLKGGAQDIAGLASQLLNLRYSRDDEFDADSRALNYTYRAGFAPRGLIEFFQKLSQLERSGGTPEFLRTHPVTTSRIQRAEEILQSGEYRGGR